MPLNPAINTKVTITSVSIKGDSVANVFNKVIELQFDYSKGMTRIVDTEQGEFYFPLIPTTVITVTVVGNVTTVVIS